MIRRSILLGLCVAFDQTGHLTANNIWLSILVSHATRLVLTYLVFAKGDWRKIKVTLDSPSATAVAAADSPQDAVREA